MGYETCKNELIQNIYHLLNFPKDKEACRFITYEEAYKRIVLDLKKPKIERNKRKLMENIEAKKATRE